MAKDRETMIDFDEEISRFQPSLEVEDIDCKERSDRYVRYCDGST